MDETVVQLKSQLESQEKEIQRLRRRLEKQKGQNPQANASPVVGDKKEEINQEEVNQKEEVSSMNLVDSGTIDLQPQVCLTFHKSAHHFQILYSGMFLI